MSNIRRYFERVMREEDGGIVSFILYILSVLYGLIQRTRAFLYERGMLRVERVGSRVISVGNITTGGTGKTPAVMSIAEAAKRFTVHGSRFKVAILTRGYRGKAKGINPVSDGSKILLGCRDAGDEPYLMAKKLSGIPVIKGNDRCLSAKFAEERFGSDLFILDDGFQHLKLHRDINILLVDATDPFGNGHILPRGILREPLESMRRADIVVLTKTDLSKRNTEIMNKIKRYNTTAPIFVGNYRSLGLVDMKGNIIEVNRLKGKSLLIFSGLANHSSFRFILEREGAKVSGELIYPDHFDYSKKDIDEIVKKAGDMGTDMIVTTEKDIVKIPYSDLETQIWALSIEFIIEDGERWESLLFSKKQSGGGNN
ncbi:MAG: tetraacyldisaccharide 4'-kinase [Nitrospirota bacterium]